MIVTKRFGFSAGHTLPTVDKKEENFHGHNYDLEVSVSGEIEGDGRVMEGSEIDRIVNERVVGRLDRSYLNNLIEIPTMENISMWVWRQLEGALPLLSAVRVYETSKSSVTYRGED